MSKLSELKLKLGRLLGQSKRKDIDIVDAWRNLCLQLNQNPTDRLLILLQWDLEQGGIDTRALKLGKKYERIEQAFSDVDVAMRIQAMAEDITNRAFERENRMLANLQAIRDSYEREIQRLTKLREEERKTQERKKIKTRSWFTE